MPQVNLSALNGQELRQLLDSSRRRGDASLSYKVLQEMAARREAPAGRRAGRAAAAAAGPSHIDLAEPGPEPADDIPPMPNWPPRAVSGEDPDDAHPDAEAEPMPEHDRPLILHDADADAQPFDDEPLHMNGASPPFEPIELGVPPRPKRSRFRLLAGLTLGLVLGLAIGWLGGWLARDAMAPAPAAASIQTAALIPRPAPIPAPSPPTPTPTPETPPEATAAQGPADLGPPPPAPAPKAPEPGPTPAPKATEPSRPPAPVPDGAALELPAPDAEVARPSRPPKKILPAAASGTAASAACAGAPTPADRVICGDPKLKRLQADLRHAYDEALAAHEDRALLREHQLAWREARSDVADPERLARLYEERIRKLNAATAEARRAQQP